MTNGKIKLEFMISSRFSSHTRARDGVGRDLSFRKFHLMWQCNQIAPLLVVVTGDDEKSTRDGV
jgi:hypothetical protein